MAVGMEEEAERKGGIALYFPANDDEASSSSSSSPSRLPRRLRRRLMESKAPSTAEEIEAKLQQADLRRQAKRRRAVGYMTQSRRACDFARVNMKGMPKQEYLSTIIARYWRKFVHERRTTFTLAKAFHALNITAKSVKSIEFEQLALQINAARTVQTVKALLARLESRFTILKSASGSGSHIENIDDLLKHVGSHGRRSNQATKTSRPENIGSRKPAKGPLKTSRYPAKAVLFAYMILGHPDTVFIGMSEFENALLESASDFVQEFELLIKIILEGPFHHKESSSIQLAFRSQLEIFDKRWCSYLYHFVVWKDKDALFFEENMMGAARQLELFMMQTSKLTLEGDNSDVTQDMQACEEQKIPAKKLQLGSSEHPSTVARLSSSELGTVCSSESQQAEYCKSGLHSVSNGTLASLSAETNNVDGGSLANSSSNRNNHSTSAKSIGERHINASDSEILVTENELVVNEIVHEQHHHFSVNSNAQAEAQNGLKAQVKETMEKAFWDGIMESMQQDEPDFSWVTRALKEVRDELLQMSPPSWRSEIAEKIDLDILSQVLNSKSLDVEYFQKLLEFTLVTLKKLSAPAKEEDIEISYLKLMEELGQVPFSGEKSRASFALLVVEGLRFVLHQIQNLKGEIASAHLRMVEPLIKSPAGLEYLKSSFSKRCGSPTDAPLTLPLTQQWLSSVCAIAPREWQEYSDSIASMNSSASVHQEVLPSTIRTGVSILTSSKIGPSSLETGKEQPECKGERLDLLIRLGLLKLVNQVKGLTDDTVPETLKLNLARLRTVQSQLQRIIVISTCLLVVRQTILNESSASRPSEVESTLSACTKHLCELLNTDENVGIPEIVDVLCTLLRDRDLTPENLQARKVVMANMLIKSLQEGDVVYSKVSQNVYLATRGVMLGGSGSKGRQLAEAALLQIGAGALTDMVVEAAEILLVVAFVSLMVHGDWYRELIKNW